MTTVREDCPGADLPPRTGGAEARALWLWDSPAILGDASARQALLTRCRCAHIDRIWMQVSLERERAADGTPRLAHVESWRALLRDAHAAGLTVEALEGSPAYALRRHHGEALAVVDAIIAHHRRVDPAERFDGLHFDIEPHGLYRWRFPEARERMATELVELLVESQRRLRAERLRFGVALPFWLQVQDEATREPIGVATFEGRRDSAAHHLIDRLDYVALMSYRDAALGPNGFVAITRDLLAYAGRAKQARVFLGLETADGTQRVRFVTGLPREQALARMRAHGEDPDALDPIDGYRRSLFDDGMRLHQGLRVPEGEGLEAPRLVAALRTLATRYGIPPPGDAAQAREAAAALSLALGILARDGEWKEMVAQPVPGEDGRSWPGFRARSITPAGITFAGQAEDLRKAMREGGEALAGAEAFAGFALHDYEHLRPLLQGR